MNTKAKDHYWLKSGFLNILQNFSGVFFGTASFVLLVRVLPSKEEYGIWTLFMTTTVILELIRNGLVQSALVRFISSSPAEEHENIITASLSISGVLTILCIAANLLLAPMVATMWKAPILVPMFYLYNIIFLFTGFVTQANCIEQANLKFNGVFATNFARQCIFFVFILICFITKYPVTLVALVYVQILCAGVAALMAYFYVKPYLHYNFRFQKEWIKKLFHYGKFAFGTSISSQLSNTLDQWMLAALMSPVASGAFNIAVRITNLVDIPTSAIATIVFPQSAKRIETDGKESIKYLYEKSVGTTMALMIPGLLVLYIFTDLVIHLLAGAKYNDSIPLLKVTLLCCLLMPYGRLFGTILDSIGKTRLTFTMVVCTATMNLTLNYFFIKRWGAMGAAYATLLSNSVGFTVAQIILRRFLRVNIWNTFIYAYQFYPEFYQKYVKKYIRPSKPLAS
ncbi:Membrane protein involved in the export of O-antigen and teichoic acid [Filimonas lacunae]|uniref:Membrane protein involved in the export of O-antigen and teichoic acid n=1 Tax=Filimonas lacunae TaxID=477680 RepID=A0A173MRF8_9BACT|nr:flippase [Filimonas lacunae]BAV10232.1 polysaccharide biosynthesis protein [Filimonas lacunae]SIT18008.1 Membrane protein involved in the export of O-antigen and teichoic acid [Filimonas lacunae]